MSASTSSRKRDRASEIKEDQGPSTKKARRYHKHQSEHERKRHKHKSDKVVNEEDEDEDEWIEKNIDGEKLARPLAQDIPSTESLDSTSHANRVEKGPLLPTSSATESKLKRDDWMLMPCGDDTVPAQPLDGDFFSSLGIERKKIETPKRPDPERFQVSSREINPHLREDKVLEEHGLQKARATTPGGPGSQWRMMKLRRIYETAEEDNRPVEEVALDRFGSLQAFEDAKEERRILDERDGKRASREDRSKDRQGRDKGEQRFMFSEVSAAGIAGRGPSFRRPGSQDHSSPSTPGFGRGSVPPLNRRVDSLRLPSEASSPATASSVPTPIPTVMTPPLVGSSGAAGLSTAELNKLQAGVLKAKLMGDPNAERLEREYETELNRMRGIPEGHFTPNVRVELLPTLDSRGRLYDTGQGKVEKEFHGRRKKKDRVETHDPKTGEFVRYNADDDSTTLGDMLRQEKFGAGMADQKDMDAQLARAIMSDGKFEDNLEYMDDNAERLGRKKMRSDAMKRQFAIHDYARTKRVLNACLHCYGEDDSPPKAPVIAMGTRCYLACTPHEELIEGHCHIVPIQHHLSTLEGDDDLWDEIRNFMKCLMRMFAEEDKGVVFYETVLNIKWQKHTYIECIPVPWDIFEQLPAYFKESILQSESEWSQHKKLIDFSARPGGFRRAMVPNLPYFMVQWDHKGEKGYGHVIEGTADAAGAGEADGAIDEGEKDGGEFPKYFAAEIIGNQLDIEPRRWRSPRRIDFGHNKQRVSNFQKKYTKYDWTRMIEQA